MRILRILTSYFSALGAQSRAAFKGGLTSLAAACALSVLDIGDVHAGPSLGLDDEIISETPLAGAFPLWSEGQMATLHLDPLDYPGVHRAARTLAEDVARVTSVTPELLEQSPQAGRFPIIIGTAGKSTLIDQWLADGRLPASKLLGKRESFTLTIIENPLPDIPRAFVIAGSDKRGTIYGIYELSEQLGVSPWVWWADVTPRQRSQVYINPGVYESGEPVVHYRGIFLNNEAPCLTGWAEEKFGGLNSAFYTRVFELLLRLRANYLWPAMWNNAFNEDDPANPRLADEYGIVMGTSHHEPMMRAHKEWTKRKSSYGNGKWDYATNSEALQRFFREGIARNKDFENVFTVGMRGDGDEGMVSQGSLEADIALLEKIFSDQRRILAEELKTDSAQVPQLWALFTEVQHFYEKGLRPPDDVTLLWTDDNTGNLRRLPTAEERKRSGGSGIYYHFDMHGGPYAFQWINTFPLAKIAEQMNLAYEYDANRIWIVNVGDLKPLEIPIEFFLRLAWNPAKWNKDKIDDYLIRWAERDFGPTHAAAIADVVARYTKYNGWRKPELVKPDTYSHLHFGEAERVEAAWTKVMDDAESIYHQLPPEKRDAYYQLVLHPTQASGLVSLMNIEAGRNHLHAMQGRASTNVRAERVRELFRQDRALRDYYNHTLSGGKWNHLMDQAHLGQFSWEPPIVDTVPPLHEVLPDARSHYGVSVEGDVNTWPDHFGDARLPAFDSLSPRSSFVDIFAIGTRPFAISIQAEEPWIVLSTDHSRAQDHRYWVNIDWDRAPVGHSVGTIQVKGSRGAVRIQVPMTKATPAQQAESTGRFASLVSPLAFSGNAASRRTEANGARWELVPDLGRGHGAVAIYPVTTATVLPPTPAPQLEYDIFLPRAGDYEVTLVLGPVMDFVPDRGMRIAVGFDEGELQTLDIFANRAAETFLGPSWNNQFTRDGVRFLRSKHTIPTAGRHTLKLAMVDPGIVVEKIIVSDRRLPSTYFGPPETTPRP